MTHDITALAAQVRQLSDRAAITELCDRYVLHLDKDRHNDDWFGAVFTDDCHLTFPMGEYKGLEGLAAFQQMARTTFESTHHIGSNYTITLDGDRADIRAHLTAVHVKRSKEPAVHFDIGGHYEATAVRTPAGWRLRRFAFDLLWTAGDPNLRHS